MKVIPHRHRMQRVRTATGANPNPQHTDGTVVSGAGDLPDWDGVGQAYTLQSDTGGLVGAPVPPEEDTTHSHDIPIANTGLYGRVTPDGIAIKPQYREFYLKMRVK